MKYTKLLFGALLYVTACASNPAPSAGPVPARATGTKITAPAPKLADPETPAGDPRNYLGDPPLYTLLAHAPLDSVARVGLAEYAYLAGQTFIDRLGEVAEDNSASVAARVNALTLIGESTDRTVSRQFASVRAALHASDPRVRAIALNTANQMRLSQSTAAMVLVKEALDDPAPEIQAKALQFVGEDDIDLLRSVIATPGRSPAVVSVVKGLVEAAEDRGAPLLPADTVTGVLQRTTGSGYTVKFTPASKWDLWDAAAGHVTLRTPQGRSVEIPGTVEVVANVVPLFFSSDSRYIVYEADRHIHVRELATSIDRDIGAGIAPRVRPVTDQFLFLVEDTTARADMRDRTKVKYNVYSAPFAAASPAVAPALLGAAGGFILQGTHGNYSPARWMRVGEREGLFYLSAEGLEMFNLPSPFGNGSGN